MMTSAKIKPKELCPVIRNIVFVALERKYTAQPRHKQFQITNNYCQPKLLTQSEQQAHQPLIKEAHKRHMMKT